MQKWEYLVVEISGNLRDSKSTYAINQEVLEIDARIPFIDFLQESGERGWELISVNDGFYYFKRPK